MFHTYGIYRYILDSHTSAIEDSIKNGVGKCNETVSSTYEAQSCAMLRTA
jgi:hypothetical protein